ncbi:glycerate kinase [Rhodoplanes sp. TEM]|uniref:Glycerate kinase n=1 Tax=Rhodoplanes tepidamans TaxID=200616 RepID=A0ABT5JES4_RHOTP|nr:MULTISPECIES: glycerate kinase [Rhodoplanes]MDC7787923.1 glycerate kinase [Rhodoplanes tepidamans]MDC7987815.1 glycerate kinase [Rhodoplanes sp. TEM]MDQ0354846.1 hydroxypyruvate reductase [Rhodoplanes tepidamans]
MSPSRDLLTKLYEAAVAAAHPSVCLPPELPPPPANGRIVVLAAGKAAGASVEAVEAHYLDKLRLPKDRLTGVAVTRHGHGRKGRVIEVVEAGHPVPDAAGLAGAEKTLALADAAGADDLVLVLVSGGASANWIAPAAGISLAAKQAVTRQLLRCGANIGEINTVRKHLSRLKGGRLAARAHPARIVTLAISDVPGDDPSVIGSGPTVPDPSTLADARAIVARYALDVPDEIRAALDNPANETPKPGDPAFADLDYRIVSRPQDAFEQVEAKVRATGLDCLLLGDRLEGEARTVAAQHAAIAKEFVAQHRRAVILSGGELTVTLRGKGRGGPNQEYVLALAGALDGMSGVAALAADTDGIDGGGGKADDPAGAFVDDTTVARARALGLDPAAFLADNDSTGFFERLGDLLRPGPTCTNINDFRAILVDR